MSIRHLPAFNFEEVVRANAARQDKIEFSVELGSIAGESHSETAGEIGNLLHFLGSPPRAQIGDEAFGRIFNRARRGVPPFLDQSIRRRTSSSQPLSPTLFAGKLRIRNPRDSISPWRFDLLLSLNPTRFLRHQRFPNPASRLLSARPRFRYNLFRSDVPPSHADEFPLVENDNWLPDDRLWSLFASPRFWPRHLRRFLKATTNLIFDDIRRAAEHAGVRIVPTQRNRFNLLSVEHYWEFYSDDPLGTVLALQPMLEAFSASHLDASDYPLPAQLESRENSRCLRISTRTGETLKIYAKTNRRIRFEVKHMLSGTAPFRLARGGHTASTIEGILPLFGQLAEIAAQRVNEVLRHFRLHASTPDGQSTVLAFIGEFQAACQDAEKAHELLQIFTTNESIVVGRGNDVGRLFRDELRRLARRQILVFSNGRYSVGPSYRQALRDMHERGIGFLLGIRRRSRPPGIH